METEDDLPPQRGGETAAEGAARLGTVDRSRMNPHAKSALAFRQRAAEMDPTRRSQTYSILLQNAPPKKVIAGPGIPLRLSLPDFVSTRELRLDFFHGARFPGGQVNNRATVFAPPGKPPVSSALMATAEPAAPADQGRHSAYFKHDAAGETATGR